MPLLKEIFSERYVTPTVMGDIMLPQQATPEKYAKSESETTTVIFYGTLEDHSTRLAAMGTDPPHWDAEVVDFARVAVDPSQPDKFNLVPKEGATTTVVAMDVTQDELDHLTAWEKSGGYEPTTVPLADGGRAVAFVLLDSSLKESYTRLSARFADAIERYARHGESDAAKPVQ